MPERRQATASCSARSRGMGGRLGRGRYAAQPDLFNCLLASIPLRIGIEISVTMTSGARRLASSNRAWPSGTLPTTSQVGASRRFYHHEELTIHPLRVFVPCSMGLAFECAA